MKKLFLFAFVLLLCSGDAFAATCSPPPTCGAGQVSRWNGSAWVCGSLTGVNISYKDCTRNGMATGSTVMTCPDGKVITELYYEGPTWGDEPDNHSFPEVYSIMCCSLGVD